MTIDIMLLLYIGKTVNLLLLLGLFQRNFQVTLTRCDDMTMSNDSGINIDTIEEPSHIEDFESLYQETTQASRATNATKVRDINFSQKRRSKSQKNTSELEMVLYVWIFF
jgi:hypothetical protein